MFRFTIRDLLWLMVAAAFGVSWLLDHRKSSAAYASVRSELISRNDEVESMRWTLKDQQFEAQRHNRLAQIHKSNAKQERAKYEAVLKCLDQRGLEIETDSNGFCVGLFNK